MPTDRPTHSSADTITGELENDGHTDGAVPSPELVDDEEEQVDDDNEDVVNEDEEEEELDVEEEEEEEEGSEEIVSDPGNSGDVPLDRSTLKAFKGKKIFRNTGLRQSLHRSNQTISPDTLAGLQTQSIQPSSAVRRFSSNWLSVFQNRDSASSVEAFKRYQTASFVGITGEVNHRVYHFHFWRDYSPVCPVCSAFLWTGVLKPDNIHGHKLKHQLMRGDGSVDVRLHITKSN